MNMLHLYIYIYIYIYIIINILLKFYLEEELTIVPNSDFKKIWDIELI